MTNLLLPRNKMKATVSCFLVCVLVLPSTFLIMEGAQAQVDLETKTSGQNFVILDNAFLTQKLLWHCTANYSKIRDYYADQKRNWVYVRLSYFIRSDYLSNNCWIFLIFFSSKSECPFVIICDLLASSLNATIFTLFQHPNPPVTNETVLQTLPTIKAYRVKSDIFDILEEFPEACAQHYDSVSLNFAYCDFIHKDIGGRKLKLSVIFSSGDIFFWVCLFLSVFLVSIVAHTILNRKAQKLHIRFQFLVTISALINGGFFPNKRNHSLIFVLWLFSCVLIGNLSIRATWAAPSWVRNRTRG